MAEQAVDQAQEAEKKQQEWVREHFQKANRFLAEKGVIPERVIVDECRFLAPFVAVWKLEAKQPKKKVYWVMSGDLPSDYVEVSVAPNAREALRHFSMMWQLKAENLKASGVTKDPTQAQFANLLVSRAEDLYKLYNDEKMWAKA